MATITAVAGRTSSSLIVKRPAWSLVYAGYPKSGSGVYENDLPAPNVFTAVFGKDYDKNIYSNACGTRVSLGLLAGGLSKVGSRNIKITVITHAYYGKSIEPGADKLKGFIKEKWGEPEQTIRFPSTIDDVLLKLRNKKGIYIMIPKSPRIFGASGHATLWTGKEVIGNHHYISDNTDAVYFWELK